MLMAEACAGLVDLPASACILSPMALTPAIAPAGSLAALPNALEPLVRSDMAAWHPGSLPPRPPLVVLLESSEEEEEELAPVDESSDEEELLPPVVPPVVPAAELWDVTPPVSGFEPPLAPAETVPDEEQPPSRMTDDARADPTRIRTPRVVDIGDTPIVVGHAKCLATLPQRVDGECTDERVTI